MPAKNSGRKFVWKRHLEVACHFQVWRTAWMIDRGHPTAATRLKHRSESSAAFCFMSVALVHSQAKRILLKRRMEIVTE
jgi:hypothetical protein